MPTTYAVIGSNCFTGSHIVGTLLEDPSNFVVGFSRSPEKNAFYLPYKRHDSKRFRFFQNDLVREADQLIALLDEFQPSYVIFVAALSEVATSNFYPLEYLQTNCAGVIRLCQELRTRSYLKRYVQVSSAEVYGYCSTPLLETAPLNPSTPYAVSKAAADLYLMTLYKNFQFPVILTRFTNVYGRHQQLYKIIPRTIINLIKGQKTQLHGGGRAVKTWIHIRDAANAVVVAAQLGKPSETYHFSDGHTYSVADLVKKICHFMGKDFKSSTESVEERVGQDLQYLLNCSKAEKELSWFPQIDFEQGIKETIRWIEDNWQEVENESLVYVHQP